VQCGALRCVALQCVAVSCSVKQCVSRRATPMPHDSMLQGVVGCCRVLQCVAVWDPVTPVIFSTYAVTCDAMCCSVLQCAVMRCRVL